jgi:phosphoribosylformimino-5-aminoimidazole carboxamide ribotide isomerase
MRIGCTQEKRRKTMELIPAIDIKDGQCVRLYQGDFNQVTQYGDPIEVARQWVACGAKRLHIVDLDGARDGHPRNIDVILGIVRSVSVPVQLGGGLRTEQAVHEVLALGVERAILGTAAVRHPTVIARLAARYGNGIAVSVDARNGKVALEGWTEDSEVEAGALVRDMARIGVRRIIYTDIHRDGTLTEPNYAATAALVQSKGPAIVASGGISELKHLQHLADLGIEAAIVGKALYSGKLDLATALQALGSTP